MTLAAAVSACGGGGGENDKLVFVTAAELDGAFGADPSSTIDGASFADMQCQSAAQGAGHEGTFVAWISRSATATLPPRNAIDVVVGDGPWRNASGDMAFVNHSALASSPQNAIYYDEYGDMHIGLAWTGTKTGGTLDEGNDCNGWHSAELSTQGAVGNVASIAQWAGGSPLSCDQHARLYCFQL